MKDASRKLLNKARHAIHAADVLLKDAETDFAAGRAYYAMFYAAQALLYEEGFRRFSKHGAVHATFGKVFAKTDRLDSKLHRWLIDAFEKRLRGDYDVESEITPTDVKKMLDQAEEFLATAKRHLAKPKQRNKKTRDTK